MSRLPAWLRPIAVGDRVTVTTMSGEFVAGKVTGARGGDHPESLTLDDRTVIPWHAIATLTKQPEIP